MENKKCKKCGATLDNNNNCEHCAEILKEKINLERW